MYSNSKDAKDAGWFSRRHQTNEAHRNAQEAWAKKLANKGKCKKNK